MKKEDWISVEDKMPPNNNDVLAGGACCDMCYNIDVGFYDIDTWALKGGDEPRFKVTHWMPLPEPPVSI